VELAVDLSQAIAHQAVVYLVTIDASFHAHGPDDPADARQPYRDDRSFVDH
jgi:hypothetical protein